MLRTLRSFSWAVIAGAILSSNAIPARASSFTVNPVQIYLSSKSPSALLTLRNDSEHTLRFQLTAVSWTQTLETQIQIEPTSEVVFYPQLVALAPREERKIRIGTTSSFGPVERTYRVFVEELPPLPGSGDDAAGVKVLTRMGIPIFLQPSRPLLQANIDSSATNDVIAVDVRNTGNAHFVAQKIRVRGFDEQKALLFDQQLDGWYVLAGSTQRYRMTIPTQACGRTTSADVEVQVGTSVIRDKVAIAPADCVR